MKNRLLCIILACISSTTTFGAQAAKRALGVLGKNAETIAFTTPRTAPTFTLPQMPASKPLPSQSWTMPTTILNPSLLPNPFAGAGRASITHIQVPNLRMASIPVGFQSLSTQPSTGLIPWAPKLKGFGIGGGEGPQLQAETAQPTPAKPIKEIQGALLDSGEEDEEEETPTPEQKQEEKSAAEDITPEDTTPNPHTDEDVILFEPTPTPIANDVEPLNLSDVPAPYEAAIPTTPVVENTATPVAETPTTPVAEPSNEQSSSDLSVIPVQSLPSEQLNDTALMVIDNAQNLDKTAQEPMQPATSPQTDDSVFTAAFKELSTLFEAYSHNTQHTHAPTPSEQPSTLALLNDTAQPTSLAPFQEQPTALMAVPTIVITSEETVTPIPQPSVISQPVPFTEENSIFTAAFKELADMFDAHQHKETVRSLVIQPEQPTAALVSQNETAQPTSLVPFQEQPTALMVVPTVAIAQEETVITPIHAAPQDSVISQPTPFTQLVTASTTIALTAGTTAVLTAKTKKLTGAKHLVGSLRTEAPVVRQAIRTATQDLLTPTTKHTRTTQLTQYHTPQSKPTPRATKKANLLADSIKIELKKIEETHLKAERETEAEQTRLHEEQQAHEARIRQEQADAQAEQRRVQEAREKAEEARLKAERETEAEQTRLREEELAEAKTKAERETQEQAEREATEARENAKRKAKTDAEAEEARIREEEYPFTEYPILQERPNKSKALYSQQKKTSHTVVDAHAARNDKTKQIRAQRQAKANGQRPDIEAQARAEKEARLKAEHDAQEAERKAHAEAEQRRAQEAREKADAEEARLRTEHLRIETEAEQTRLREQELAEAKAKAERETQEQAEREATEARENAKRKAKTVAEVEETKFYEEENPFTEYPTPQERPNKSKAKAAYSKQHTADHALDMQTMRGDLKTKKTKDQKKILEAQRRAKATGQRPDIEAQARAEQQAHEARLRQEQADAQAERLRIEREAAAEQTRLHEEQQAHEARLRQQADVQAEQARVEAEAAAHVARTQQAETIPVVQPQTATVTPTPSIARPQARPQYAQMTRKPLSFQQQAQNTDFFRASATRLGHAFFDPAPTPAPAPAAATQQPPKSFLPKKKTIKKKNPAPAAAAAAAAQQPVEQPQEAANKPEEPAKKDATDANKDFTKDESDTKPLKKSYGDDEFDGTYETPTKKIPLQKPAHKKQQDVLPEERVNDGYTPAPAPSPRTAERAIAPILGNTLAAARNGWASPSPVALTPQPVVKRDEPTTEDLNLQAARQRVVELPFGAPTENIEKSTKKHGAPKAEILHHADDLQHHSSLHPESWQPLAVTHDPVSVPTVVTEQLTQDDQYPDGFPNLAPKKESAARYAFDLGKSVINTVIIQPLKHLAQYVADVVSNWLK